MGQSPAGLSGYSHLAGGYAGGQAEFPSFVITHRLKLEDGPGAYKIFRDKQDECIKVVLTP